MDITCVAARVLLHVVITCVVACSRNSNDCCKSCRHKSEQCLQTKEQAVLVNTRASGACKHKSERCLVYVCVCQVASHDSKVLAQTLEKEHSQLRDLSVKYR